MDIIIKEETGHRRLSLESFLMNEPYDYERDEENLEELLCDSCGAELDIDGLCFNCDFFEPERDAWTAND